MALTLSSLGTNAYTGTAVLLLTSWILTALGFTALNVLNSSSSYTESVASTTLLTFLVARLIALTTDNDDDTQTIAHTLTSAHRHSRKAALLFFAFTCSWLYELLTKAVLSFFLTVLGFAVTAIVYNDPQGEGWNVADNGNGAQPQDNPSTTALAEIDDFKTRAGVDFDPTVIFKWIPPQALVYFVLMIWVNFATLGVYLLRYAWRDLRRVLGSSTAIAVPVVVVQEEGK